MNLKELDFDQFYKRWALIASIMHGVCLILVIFFYAQTMIWGITSLLLFGIYIVKMAYHIPSLPLWFGYANWVSILRLMCVLCLFFFHPFIKDIYLFWGFLGAILLDGVDGFLARRFKQASRVGEILDMEIDAFMVLILSWIHFNQGNTHWSILIPGFFKYIYEIVVYLAPGEEKEILPKRVRSTIAVIFFLTLLIPFITDQYFGHIMLYISGVLILISFCLSFYGRIVPQENSFDSYIKRKD
tara:strand:- start:509 stop:1237 length:729 start_codon:yes stop_codon:yes gene_type:complete